MRERRLEIVFLAVRTIISIILITMISFVIMSLVKDIPGRELKYGAAMPVFSRIIINGDTLNYMNISKLIAIEILVFNAPVLGYILTGDEIKSAPLCMLPAMLWGVLAWSSFKITPINDEVILMLMSAFVHSIVSILLYLKFLHNDWLDLDEDDDYEEFDYDLWS